MPAVSELRTMYEQMVTARHADGGQGCAGDEAGRC